MPEHVSREAILFNMSGGVVFEIERHSPSCEITEELSVEDYIETSVML